MKVALIGASGNGGSRRERTGKFRLGKDQLLTHDKGSNISWEDYAIAAVD